ncbi:carbon-nitrogen hydrolase family protein [Acuticoccus sp. I52.16.1]|uniref:carbon-nitrogen hydrolase family protein n=1 Tax=Acuticoccus sp. I52.16.1 TaxID=2928472 RepID=UPI001FD36274|nr:carbon-nitrogen hydrolase family protein [Acuticoccus sp. I52.16.1]UOM35729.1 carbon-nitrogen hydrolase family protein [Acuticoccus sp. I52.16.1]
MRAYPKFRACAAHVSAVFLDAERTVDKAVSLIGEAARAGAAIIAFPESFVPGFPIWAALQAPIRGHDLFRALAAQSVEVPGPEVRRLCEAARRHGIMVSVGISEATTASVGCLWNSNLLIGADGAILNHHRKLVPTFFEKLIWANGDAAGLTVTDTPIGRIGMLICGENTNPLARYALMAQGEQVHISSYPPTWPTRDPGEAGRYDLTAAIRVRAGAHAFEAKVFNIVSSAVVDATMEAAIERLGADAVRILKDTPQGASMVLGPDAEPVGDVMTGDEGLLYADIDVGLTVEPKQFHDVVGYYNRFDIFRLEVDAAPREPIAITAGEGRSYPYDGELEPDPPRPHGTA